MADLAYVPSVVRQQFEALGPPQPLRRGSLSERYMTCGKPGCACAEDPDARHGPYFSLTRTVHGRTESRLVGATQAELVRQQVTAGQEFRTHIEAYWQACEQWADDQLTPETAAHEAAKKGGSKRRLSPRSWGRSKRS